MPDRAVAQRGGRPELARRTVIGVPVYEVLPPLLGQPVEPWDIGATVVAGAAGGCLTRPRLAPEQTPRPATTRGGGPCPGDPGTVATA